MTVASLPFDGMAVRVGAGVGEPAGGGVAARVGVGEGTAVEVTLGPLDADKLGVGGGISLAGVLGARAEGVLVAAASCGVGDGADPTTDGVADGSAAGATSARTVHSPTARPARMQSVMIAGLDRARTVTGDLLPAPCLRPLHCMASPT